MCAVSLCISTVTTCSSACAISAPDTGSGNSGRAAMAACLAGVPVWASSTRSASVRTIESARIGRATASTSAASRTATSCGKCGECRRLCAKAERTVTSMSLAITRTISCAIASSVGAMLGPSSSCASLPMSSARNSGEGLVSSRATSAWERESVIGSSMPDMSKPSVNAAGRTQKRFPAAGVGIRPTRRAPVSCRRLL